MAPKDNIMNSTYDALGGYDRLAEALSRIDERAMHIMTFHVALEAEMDLVLAGLLKRPEALGTGFGFPNKVRVLRAAWTGDEDVGQAACEALHAFNELRNRVAHGNKKEIRGNFNALVAAYQAIDATATRRTPIAEIAQGIMAHIGGAPLPPVMNAIVENMDRLSDAMHRLAGSLRVGA